MNHERYVAKRKLINASLSHVQSERSMEDHPENPNGDAECEYADENLLTAAREYVAVHDGAKTAAEDYAAKHAETGIGEIPVKRPSNTGHGHVYSRPDGVKARCGGPGICSECSRDLAALRLQQRGHGDG